MNIFITEHGAKLNIRGNRLIINSQSESKEIPIGLIESLSLHKSVQITSQAICALSTDGIDISWLSGGNILCRTFGSGNVIRQKLQFEALHNKKFLLRMA